MRYTHYVAVWVASVSVMGGWGGLAAQDARAPQEAELGLYQSRGDNRPDLGYALLTAPVRERGQPVIPIFEGWIPNIDGMIDGMNGMTRLSFSYFNLNSKEAVDIPLGPGNFIEPREFDGNQPTHFVPASQCCNRRYLSAFTVDVPGDFKGDVVWTLVQQGRTYSVPGRTTYEAYRMDNMEAFTVAPVSAELRFGGEGGPAGRGRSGVTFGPLTVAVGNSLPLSVWVDPQPASATLVVGSFAGKQGEPRTKSILRWYHHQGPGQVNFSEAETILEGGPGEVSTTATFSEPGDYVLRIWAVENFQSVNQHCCWTTAYIRVTVTP